MHDVRRIHKEYGPVVRLAPNEISFAKEEAWHDIFRARPGQRPFLKNPIYFTPPPGQPHNIVTTADVEDHARMRQVLNHAFTPTALKAQEPIIESYVDLLITRLREKAISSELPSNEIILNIVDWYNYTAFDIVGDLGFGEPFNCLKDGALHPWIALIFNYIKAMTLAASARYYPWLSLIVTRFLVPRRILKMTEDHYQLAISKIHRRMNLEQQRIDFMTPVLKQGILAQGQEGEGMTLPEIESTFSMLIIAGSETVSTTLSGLTSYLLRHPRVFRTLTSEILTTFTCSSQITITAVRDLPYLNAVIQEGLRMCNPVPAGLARVAPKGGSTVCGLFLPEGTNVSVHAWTIATSASLFHKPEEFIPERWLPGPERPVEHANDQVSAIYPFSIGARACIGKQLALAEMRLILARLAWGFEMGRPKELKDVVDWEMLKTYVVVQKEPVWVRLRIREGTETHLDR